MTKKGILIVGHGSSYPYNKKIMELQAERLGNMGFENVYIGFNERSEPTIEEAVSMMAAEGIDDIVALPFFIASGLHMTRDIPPKLGLSEGETDAVVNIGGNKLRMRFATPFGDSPLLGQILYENVMQLDSGEGNLGVLVIGHGSKLPYNKETIMLNAERLGEKLDNVRYAFNEFNEPHIEPTMTEMIEAGVNEIVVLPLFISLGDHLKNDIPKKIGLADGVSEGSFKHEGIKVTVKYAAPIGKDPRLTDVLADKIKAYF